jgi:hypothetical protein
VEGSTKIVEAGTIVVPGCDRGVKWHGCGVDAGFLGAGRAWAGPVLNRRWIGRVSIKHAVDWVDAS